MATRHFCANLERRGHIFYWRARVPVRFRRVPRQARLSFSLRLSDHLRATYMAQRLNTLLADLTVRPTAAMTTKDQLDRIFRAEIERMSAHLDDIAFAARRTGSTDDVREMEADIEVGWAYRLIQLFGTGRLLAFDEGCPGRSLLLRHGIPEPHIPLIAETFRAEQKEAASALFDRQVRQQMAEVGLPDTLANCERAKMELFRAKADALLDVGGRWPMIDRSQNALVASTLPEDERPSFRPDSIIDRDALEPGASGMSQPSRGPVIDRLNALDAPASQVVLASATAIDPHEAAAPLAMVAAAPSEKISIAPIVFGPSGTEDAASNADLPISKFDEEFERLHRNNRENWEPATASDVRALAYQKKYREAQRAARAPSRADVANLMLHWFLTLLLENRDNDGLMKVRAVLIEGLTGQGFDHEAATRRVDDVIERTEDGWTIRPKTHLDPKPLGLTLASLIAGRTTARSQRSGENG